MVQGEPACRVEVSTNAYYVALEVTGVWHVSDDELLRPRCGEDMVPNLRVPVIDEEEFRAGYKVCRECDPEAQKSPVEDDLEAAVQAGGALVQTRLCDVDGAAA